MRSPPFTPSRGRPDRWGRKTFEQNVNIAQSRAVVDRGAALYTLLTTVEAEAA